MHPVPRMSLLLLALLLVAADVFALWLVLSGAPFVPAKTDAVERIVEGCDPHPGMKAADIGSGDGRILLALARAGAEAHGYEINPFLVWWSRRRIRRAGLDGRAFVHWKNLWRADFSPFDAVTLFGVGHIMRRLETKLRNELKPGAKAVSLAFAFPTWTPSRKIGEIIVYEQP